MVSLFGFNLVSRKPTIPVTTAERRYATGFSLKHKPAITGRSIRLASRQRESPTMRQIIFLFIMRLS